MSYGPAGIIRCLIAVVIYIVFEDLGSEIVREIIWAGVWSETKPHLLNKLNYVLWDVPRIRQDSINASSVKVGAWRKTYLQSKYQTKLVIFASWLVRCAWIIFQGDE